MSSSKVAVSLFSGAGGMDIGVIGAGYRVLACLEVDPYACETLRANIRRHHRKTLVIEEDIRQIDPADLLTRLGVNSGQIDLLFGGPPCQSFSQIGKQSGLDDERGLLLFQMVRFAERLEPKALMIENVKGLLSARDRSGRRGGVFSLFVKKLQDLGYDVKWSVINSADYGVAQLRKRVFIVCTRQGVKFRFPEPTHRPLDGSVDMSATKHYVTVGEALAGLRGPLPKGSQIPADSHYDVTPDGDRRRIHGVPEGGHLSGATGVPDSQKGRLLRKDTTKFLRLGRQAQSNTLRCGEIFFHPTEESYLTPREYMRLHGYPDGYMLRGPIRSRSGSVRFLDQHRQVANSVPPPVALAVAYAIRRSCRAKNL